MKTAARRSQRALAVLVDKNVPDPAAPGALDALRRDRDILQKRIAELEQRLDRIEGQLPFLLREKLAGRRVDRRTAA